jgi:hypothetical protein
VNAIVPEELAGGWMMGIGVAEGVNVGVSAMTGVALGGTGVSVGSDAGAWEVEVNSGALVIGGSGVGPAGVLVGMARGPGRAQLARRTVKRTAEMKVRPDLE